MKEPKGYEEFLKWLKANDGYESGEHLKKQAMLEINYETFRNAVEKEKERLLTSKPWYNKLFPFRINLKIERI